MNHQKKKPINFEEVLRRGQDRFKSVLPPKDKNWIQRLFSGDWGRHPKVEEFKPYAYYNDSLDWVFYYAEDISTYTAEADRNASGMDKCIDAIVTHDGRVVGFKIWASDLILMLQDRVDSEDVVKLDLPEWKNRPSDN